MSLSDKILVDPRVPARPPSRFSRLWRRLPYWLRGAFIGLVLGILSVLLTDLCADYHLNQHHGNDLADMQCLVLLGPGLLVGFLPTTISPIFTVKSAVIVIWFVVGAIIGLIVGLFKKKSPPLR